MIVVRLDNAAFGGGPGTVIGHVIDVNDGYRDHSDRDGARDPRIRVWAGKNEIGDRVCLSETGACTCEERSR